MSDASEQTARGGNALRNLSAADIARISRLFYKVPASATDEGKERIRAYYEALGRFVGKYADAEDTVQRVLRIYARTPPGIARSIFSGTRIAAGMSFIRRICEATGVSKPAQDELAGIAAQLGHITTMRDYILHFGARSVAEGEGIVTNAPRAHTPAKVVTFPVNPTILGHMTADLEKVIVCLLDRHAGVPPVRGAANRALLDAISQRPWRYKPVQLPLPEAHKLEAPDDPSRTILQGPPPPSGR